jgi:hypothetical protein
MVTLFFDFNWLAATSPRFFWPVEVHTFLIFQTLLPNQLLMHAPTVFLYYYIQSIALQSSSRRSMHRAIIISHSLWGNCVRASRAVLLVLEDQEFATLILVTAGKSWTSNTERLDVIQFLLQTI